MPTQTKEKCGDPFCSNPTETECAGEKLCKFCQAERLVNIQRYPSNPKPPADDGGLDIPIGFGTATVNPVYEMSDEEWEQEQRDREEASRAYDHEDRDANDVVEIPA